MKRLTTVYNAGRTWDEVQNRVPYSKIYRELEYYEDLEEKLESVYGECDGLLEKVVDHLIKHPEIEIGEPTKSRLLTDEDVDKWERWKDLEEQG